jgi:hypothetical protein
VHRFLVLTLNDDGQVSTFFEEGELHVRPT